MDRLEQMEPNRQVKALHFLEMHKMEADFASIITASQTIAKLDDIVKNMKDMKQDRRDSAPAETAYFTVQ